MIQLNEKYNQEDFLDFLSNDFLSDFEKDVRPANSESLTVIAKATYLGKSKSLDLHIFEFSYSESHANKRVALAMDGFRIMKSTATFNALIIFNPANKNKWRLSLMTASPEKNEKGGVSVHLSNPRRFSFELGENTKINTPFNFLIKKGKISDLDDLKKRFSIEVVNKEFYAQISELFTELVGGTRGEGRKQRKYPGIIALPSLPKESRENHEFAVRLIGRLIFCWFLREKKSDSDLPLISKEILSLEAANNNPDYYHSILEPLFFEVLNKPFKLRTEDFRNGLFGKTPYLNGGLFTPQTWDYYDSKLRFILNIPDEWIRKLFEVLELYNFTVDENTSVDIDLSIDPEMLGRIFENLLAEINPETGETARKATGSYYTPRTIVDYMVDESLIQYLKGKTNIDESKIRVLVSYDLNDDEEYPLNEVEKDKVVELLSKITILDPACGSGAFPIGTLQKIVFILQRIDQDAKLWFKQQIEGSAPEIKRIIEREFAERNFDYIRKLGIIRQSIFGVDIQPIATEIARLRCFLTLVVDERVDDEEENRGVEPLPNLDFKFVTANSLIGLPSSQINSQVGLFEDQEGINKLKEVRDMYFNASGSEREQLKLQFVQIQNKMFQKMIHEHTLADLTQKLSTWDPFGHDASDWFDPDWMFGIKEGFDIVIGNPPYVRVEKISETEVQQFKKVYLSSTGKFDLYFLFFEVSISKLLNSSGLLSFICSYQFLYANSGIGLRKFLIDNTSTDLMMFSSSEQVFNSATTYTGVFIASKSQKPKFTIYSASFDTSHSIMLSNKIELSKDNMYSSKVIISNSSILDEINNSDKFVPCSFIGSAKCGVVTSADDIFYLSKETVEVNSLEKEIIHPVYGPDDIDKFTLSKPKVYCIYPYNNEKGNTKLIDLEFLKRQYNNIYRYFIKNKTVLTKRSQGRKDYAESAKWYQLNRPREKWIFDSRKLIYAGTAIKPIFAMDDRAYLFRNARLYGFVLNQISITTYKYLLGIFNSKLAAYFASIVCPPKSHGYYEFSTSFVDSFPIPRKPLDETQLQEPIAELVNKVILLKSKDSSTDTVELEKQIDQLVYKLYDLTPEEIAVVEGRNN